MLISSIPRATRTDPCCFRLAFCYVSRDKGPLYIFLDWMDSHKRIGLRSIRSRIWETRAKGRTAFFAFSNSVSLGFRALRPTLDQVLAS